MCGETRKPASMAKISRAATLMGGFCLCIASHHSRQKLGSLRVVVTVKNLWLSASMPVSYTTQLAGSGHAAPGDFLRAARSLFSGVPNRPAQPSIDRRRATVKFLILQKRKLADRKILKFKKRDSHLHQLGANSRQI